MSGKKIDSNTTSSLHLGKTEFTHGKRAGIYARYSPDRDRDQNSTIGAQVAMYREKAQRDGISIHPNHIYVDRGIPVRASRTCRWRIDGNPW